MRIPLIFFAASLSVLAQTNPHRTDWSHAARWGVFTHYLADKGTSVEDWNRRVDGFDVELMARQLERVGARYYFITLGQNSGHYIAPNAAYDRHTGIRPSKCARRDLVADLHKALSARGIRLLVYLPSGAPDEDEPAMKALGWRKSGFDYGFTEGGAGLRLVEFQRKWESVIREWSMRWSSRISGWWFDGCYWPNAMYRHADPPNFASLAAAARAGNPQTIVAFNQGVIVPILSITPEEDYTAGEINDPVPVRSNGRWRDGAQFHMLSYLGKAWAQGPPRFTDEQAVQFTKQIVDKGGVVSWDVPVRWNGEIPGEFLKQLLAIRRVSDVK